VSVFSGLHGAASSLQVWDLLFFVRFLRKKETGSTPVPGAGAARGYNLIYGDRNGVFSTYFEAHGDWRDGMARRCQRPFVNLLA
tara:strand:- start:575 stop:826 length:252 start_codon:yes stop_codon:yes gene_type:complete